MPSVCMVHAALAGDAYVSVAPPLYTANVLGEVFIVDINIFKCPKFASF